MVIFNPYENWQNCFVKKEIRLICVSSFFYPTGSIEDWKLGFHDFDFKQLLKFLIKGVISTAFLAFIEKIVIFMNSAFKSFISRYFSFIFSAHKSFWKTDLLVRFTRCCCKKIKIYELCGFSNLQNDFSVSGVLKEFMCVHKNQVQRHQHLP